MATLNLLIHYPLYQHAFARFYCIYDSLILIIYYSIIPALNYRNNLIPQFLHKMLQRVQLWTFALLFVSNLLLLIYNYLYLQLYFHLFYEQRFKNILSEIIYNILTVLFNYQYVCFLFYVLHSNKLIQFSYIVAARRERLPSWCSEHCLWELYSLTRGSGTVTRDCSLHRCS